MKNLFTKKELIEIQDIKKYLGKMIECKDNSGKKIISQVVGIERLNCAYQYNSRGFTNELYCFPDSYGNWFRIPRRKVIKIIRS